MRVARGRGVRIKYVRVLLSGDALLEQVTKDDESVNHSMVLDIIDWYKKAIIQTRELDVGNSDSEK